jgi:hypothetical protein
MTLRISHNVPIRALEMVLEVVSNYLKVADIRSAHGKPLPVRFAKVLHIAGAPDDGFIRHVYCADCGSIYPYDINDKDDDGLPEVFKCTYVKFPENRERAECGAVLWKPWTNQRGVKSWLPQVIFPRLDLVRCIRQFFARPGFAAEIEHWRKRAKLKRKKGLDTYLMDVYDGELWAHFQTLTMPNSKMKRLLSKKYQLAFACSVDWFKQFKHTQHSSAPIFLAIQNLPRRRRFLQTNIITAGMMPGPREAPDVSMLMTPLMEELVLLGMNGIYVDVEGEKEKQKIRCILFSMNCDLPAKAKVTGHAGTGAKQGCSFCKQEFVYGHEAHKCLTACMIEPPPRRAADPCPWVDGVHRLKLYPARTTEQHRKDIAEWEGQANQSQRDKKQKASGAHRTPLTKLWYWDTVQQVTLDTFHNMYLGTPRHMMRMFVKQKIIAKHEQKIIQDWLRDLLLPVTHSRFAQKIATTDAKKSFTDVLGAEWRMWTLYWSEPALEAAGLFNLDFAKVAQRSEMNPKDLAKRPEMKDLDAKAVKEKFDEEIAERLKEIKEKLDVWSLYTRACRLVDTRCVLPEDLTEAEILFEKFHWEFQRVFGVRKCKPNIHAHLHICAAIRRFGPSQSFWNIVYERLNGQVGRTSTNNRAKELQQMKRMYQASRVEALGSELADVQPDWPKIALVSGQTVDPANDETELNRAMLVRQHEVKLTANGSEAGPGNGLLGRSTKTMIKDQMLDQLKEFYTKQKAYQNPEVYEYRIDDIADLFHAYDHGGYLLKSVSLQRKRSYVYARFNDGRELVIFVGEIQGFYRHDMIVQYKKGKAEKRYPHTLAYVRWFTNQGRSSMPYFKRHKFCTPDWSCWIPMTNLLGHCGYHVNDALTHFSFIALPFEIAC